MRPLLFLAVAATLAAPAPALAARIDAGTILTGRGAQVTVKNAPVDVTIGMTRKQALKLLGKPVFQNAFGYMQYSKKNLFDLYVDPATKRVDLIGISGPAFCLPFGICMLQEGGLKALRTKFGGALKRRVAEDGEVSYAVVSRREGTSVRTEFFVDADKGSAKIVQVFVGLVR